MLAATEPASHAGMLHMSMPSNKSRRHKAAIFFQGVHHASSKSIFDFEIFDRLRPCLSVHSGWLCVTLLAACLGDLDCHERGWRKFTASKRSGAAYLERRKCLIPSKRVSVNFRESNTMCGRKSWMDLSCFVGSAHRCGTVNFTSATSSRKLEGRK